ncbi:MAG TPA: hypothetical protein VGG33_19320, partial [Polyangia bacterium]
MTNEPSAKKLRSAREAFRCLSSWSKRSLVRALGVSLLFAGVACREGESGETALLLEVTSALPPEALDVVAFRVEGAGVEPGGRVAEAPLVGPDAKRFPLQLV